MAVGTSELGRLELGWREPEDWELGSKTQGEGTDTREGKRQQPAGLELGEERSH